MTATQVRERLRRACEQCGGLRAWSRAHGVSVQQVSRILLEQEGISDRMAAEIGLVKTISWIPVAKGLDNDGTIR